MRVKIYQINMDRDADNVKFMGTDARKSLHLNENIDPGIYDEVFNAEIKETDPEDIYRRFNTEGHPLHRGHSLSVSDVVVTDQGAYFCDSIGFKEIPFDESKTQKPENLMRVVYVEPGEKPYTAEILHTLHAEQKAVGGLIEPIYNGDDTILVGNEESKLIGMQGNRRIGDGAAVFENLYPTLKYRIMETEAPEGHTLLKDPIYVELQSAAGFETAYRIVNGDTFTLPNTGSISKVLFLLSAAVFGVLGAIVLTAGLKEDRKKK